MAHKCIDNTVPSCAVCSDREYAIVRTAGKFRDKVTREAPKCFTPSRELQALFDALERAEL